MHWKLKKILYIAFAFFFAAVFLFKGILDFVHGRQLLNHGQETTGLVLKLESFRMSRIGPPVCNLEIQFQPGSSAPLVEHLFVSKTIYDALNVGDSVKVHYLPESPAICQVGNEIKTPFGLILGGIGMLLGGVFLIAIFKQSDSQEELVVRFSKHLQTMALREFKYESVQEKSFRHLDLAFYKRVQSGLEANGFRHIDDQQNVTLRQRKGIRTLLRLLLGSDRSTMATIYHFVPKWSLRIHGAKQSKVLDLENWISDGSFVCTSNSENTRKFDLPPGIHSVRLSAETPWNMVLEIHRRRLSQYLESNPGTQLVELNGLEDIRRAQAEIQRIKSEFRKQVGLSKAELQRFGVGTRFDIDQVHDALAQRRERGLDSP